MRAGIELGVCRCAEPCLAEAFGQPCQFRVWLAEERAVKSVAMVPAMTRAAEAGCGELCGRHAAMSRPSGVQPLRPAAVGHEGEQAAAHAGGEAHGVGKLRCVEPLDISGCRRGRDRAYDAGGVETSGVETAA